MSDDPSRKLIMEEPWGPNTPSEFEDYDESQSRGQGISSASSDYKDSVDFLEFGYSPSETDYPLEENSVERASLIGSFQTIFTKENSPYDENWDFKTTDEFLEWTSEQDYEGLLAVDEGKVIGFTWGYRVDPCELDVESKFPDEIQQVNENIYDGETFMLDEIGVVPEYRGQGIGKDLESGLLEKLSDREDISRVMQRTQWSGENTPKLQIDYDLGFENLTYCKGDARRPVLQEVDFVGSDMSDERAYLLKEFGGDK